MLGTKRANLQKIIDHLVNEMDCDLPESMKVAILAQEDINALDNQGRSLFSYVISLDDDAAITDYLLRNGADPYLKTASGRTALTIAINNEMSAVIEKLLQQENSQIARSNFFLRTLEASNTTQEIVKHLLQSGMFTDDELLAKNKLRQNALHIAILKNNIEYLQVLLTDKRFAALLEERDFFGARPIDLARESGSAEMLKLFTHSNEEIQLSPPRTNVNQNILNSKLMYYITHINSYPYPATLIITEGGQCNGWSYLWGHYLSKGKEAEFVAIKRAIASWDQSEEDLSRMTLPSCIQRKYKFTNPLELQEDFLNESRWFADLNAKKETDPSSKKAIEEFNEMITTLMLEFSDEDVHGFANALYNELVKKYEEYKKLDKASKKTYPFKEICEDLFEKYNDRQDLFENIIPSVVLLQHTSSVAVSVTPMLTQDSRVEQTQVLGIDSPTALGTYLVYHMNKAQLKEMLSFYAQYPGIYLDIGGGDHAVGLMVTEKEGSVQFKYFDSNWKYEKDVFTQTEIENQNTFKSIDDLVDHIFEYKYGPAKIKNDKIKIGFNPWKFPQSQIKVLSHEPAKESANNFSPLHWAAFQYALHPNEDTEKEMCDIIEQDPSLLKAKDNSGNTPLHLILANPNRKLVQSIIKKHHIDPNEILDDETVFCTCLAIPQCKDLLKLWIDQNVINHNEPYSVLKYTTFMRAILVTADPEIIAELAKHADLNACDFLEESALVYAVKMQNNDAVNIIIKQAQEKDVVLDLSKTTSSRPPKNVFELAADNPIILEKLHQYKRQTDKSQYSQDVELKRKHSIEALLQAEQPTKAPTRTSIEEPPTPVQTPAWQPLHAHKLKQEGERTESEKIPENTNKSKKPEGT